MNATPAPIQTFSERVLNLIRRTVASDCNDDEFRIFIRMAERLHLDPLRKQIYAMVFSKDNPKKRRMSIITAIDGFRTIAARQGNYRPDDDEPEIFAADTEKNPDTNPAGLVKAIVKVFFQDKQGEWYAVAGLAYWDEFVPIRDGKIPYDSNWRRMPRVMLCKCAEAQALRKGWPDDLSNVYEASELDQAQTNEDAIERMETAKQERRAARLGGPVISVAFSISEPLVSVPAGKLADKAIEHVKKQNASAKVKWFRDTNVESFNQLWAHDADAALTLKETIENRIEALTKKELSKA